MLLKPAEPPGVTSAGVVANELYREADLSKLAFETTAELEPLDGLIGQTRALDAIRFGAGVHQPGFNLIAVGRADAGMRQAVRTMLGDLAPARQTPSDWIYVNNFADERRPIAIALPPGRAPTLHQAMHELIADLKASLPAVFTSEDYQTRRGAIDDTFQRQHVQAIAAVGEKAREKGIALLQTPMGFTLTPLEKGEAVAPERFDAWPEEKQRRVRADMEALEKEIEHVLRQIPQREKARREAIRELNRKTAETAVGHLIEDRKAEFSDVPAIAEHLERVRADLIDNVPVFIVGEAQIGGDEMMPGGPFDRYEINVLVTNASAGAPIVEESHPTLGNVTGSIEHLSRQGVLVTNFRLIKAGAIHRANGGYLLLDARNLLVEPFTWTALKRLLRRGEIVIEDVSRLLGLSSTVSLEPDPIPLDVKVVLFADRLLYFLLSALDPELSEHFKVLAEFDDDMDRSPDSEALFARLVGSIAHRAGLNPLDRGAVALTIEHATRLADNSGKLAVLVDQIRDVLVEADYWAKEAGRTTTTRPDVERSINERLHRAGRLKERMQEAILQNIALIETTGARVGQVNGLSVIEAGGFSFGRPTRITCQARPGSGRVIDIEREVELGGPIHSKGVLILSGFLAGGFALDTPMSLHASMVFEQSYGAVEGDSASLAELCALLSALAEAPLRQDVAVTGSVNQHGEVQAIGGVNEKVEGFFDICAARGLTGGQGVIIPRSNLQHLMLRKDVRDACAGSRFAIHAVSSANEALTILTGLPTGERGADGRFPDGSINRRVEDRLRAFAEVRRAFAAGSGTRGDALQQAGAAAKSASR